MKSYTEIAAELALVEGISVYVLQSDFKAFMVNTFARLPRNASIVLVVGGEDSGAPMELFGMASRDLHGHRKRCFWHCLPRLNDFLADTRLKHMFVQNYDLLGCDRNYMNSARYNHGGCLVPPELAWKKVTPIPIGLDFHTSAEKKQVSPISACPQASELNSIFSAAKPWADRLDCVAVTFGSEYENRADLLSVINRSAGTLCTQRLNADRSKMWRRAAGFRFGFAPSGRGIDTHRFWEYLVLGVVPVVVRSSLDDLYQQFPVVFLDSWEEAAIPMAIGTWYTDILKRFGEQPFAHVDVQERLRMDFWAGVIQRTSAS